MSVISTRLTEVVPDVHFTAERPYFDDLLTEKVVRLSSELGPKPRLQVVVLVPVASPPSKHRDPRSVTSSTRDVTTTGDVMALKRWLQIRFECRSTSNRSRIAVVTNA